MNIRKLIKSLLFIFVVLSFAVLIYKEFSPKNESDATNMAEKGGDRTSVSGKSMPASKSQTAREAATKQKEEASSPHIAVKSQNSKVIAYYFHGTYRCSTCQTIERYSREAIENYFSKELRDGRLEFKPLNTDEPENRHFIQDYQLFTKSLVITLYKDDKQIKWKNLTEVWVHVGDKENFYKYVKDEIESLLKEIE